MNLEEELEMAEGEDNAGLCGGQASTILTGNLNIVPLIDKEHLSE